jgi:hypothetical protein
MSELTDDQKLEAYIRELLEVPAPIVSDDRTRAQLERVRSSLETHQLLRDFWANPEKYNYDCPF